ncbi:hypothetical protein F503_06507 [Ophiostoma piceae UAMH 11346]|uniref:Uncharacterized protein n=1 Tax=Ophiostoma piceae (strain UAMH 11346) TaxID=1262450 RepID=S3BWK9_OPHP1|nr:hypothetical protein F503_06507 [Ophiostoma piceae UAMH 11346]
MRLQQATNTQVGITSSMRARWFEELRSIAQCFVAAQQTSAKLEGASNTERGQLKGALRSALDELETMRAQRDDAKKEAVYLRGRLDELVAQLRLQEKMPTHHFDQQRYFPAESSHVEPTDILQQLPKAVEDMPFSPQQRETSQTSRSAPLKARGNSNRGYHNNQSRFFGRLQAAPSDSSKCSTSGQSTPDFYSGLARGQISQTPNMPQGPFTAPAASRQSTERHIRNGQLAISASPFQAPQSFQKAGSVGSSGPHARSSHSHAAPSSQASRLQAPVHSSELVLRTEQNLNDFSPGVTPHKGSTDEERVTGIFGLFNAIKVWVLKYCGSPDEDSMSSLGSQYPQLWDYVLNITYPNNRQNAASHAGFLLTNRATRCYFIARMLIQYVAESLWNPEAWEGHDRRLTSVLVGIKQKLDPKFGYDAALQPHERHALVDKRSSVIYDFISQPGWTNSEASRIAQTTNRLKEIVGPMLSSGDLDYESALNELSGISGTALRLSAVLNTCRLSFQYQFNECGIKFSEQSHRALNNALTGRELQSQQWRVMCVVTPGITYRNDAGTSMDPRLLAKANVLVMQ